MDKYYTREYISGLVDGAATMFIIVLIVLIITIVCDKIGVFN